MRYVDRLRHFMATQGMTQKELGKRVGLTASSLSRILNGTQQPKLGEAYVIARELGVTLNDLVEDDDADYSPPTGSLLRVSQDDVCLLRVAHTLGVDLAMARLVNAEPPRVPVPLPERPAR